MILAHGQPDGHHGQKRPSSQRQLSPIITNSSYTYNILRYNILRYNILRCWIRSVPNGWRNIAFGPVQSLYSCMEWLYLDGYVLQGILNYINWHDLYGRRQLETIIKKWLKLKPPPKFLDKKTKAGRSIQLTKRDTPLRLTPNWSPPPPLPILKLVYALAFTRKSLWG